MKKYFPTPQDIAELNSAAEKITDANLKSAPLCKIAKRLPLFTKNLAGVIPQIALIWHWKKSPRKVRF